jgi:hypothetical protein
MMQNDAWGSHGAIPSMMLEISAGKVDRENLACNESHPIGSANRAIESGLKAAAS